MPSGAPPPPDAKRRRPTGAGDSKKALVSSGARGGKRPPKKTSPDSTSPDGAKPVQPGDEPIQPAGPLLIRRPRTGEQEAGGGVALAAAPAPATTSTATTTTTTVAPGKAEPKAEPEEERKASKGLVGFFRELPVLLIIAFVLALVIKTFLVQAFYIPSASMEPTLQIGDRVLVNKVVYHLHPPRRGDIIVFEDPHPLETVHRNPVSAFVHWLTSGLGVSTNPEKDFIKRVIGLPGDTVEIDGRGVVMINGKPLSESYLSPIKDTRPYGPVKVPPNSLFVMGDNRTNSNDSRYGLGMIPYDKVVGRAFVIIWPPSRISWLRRT